MFMKDRNVIITGCARGIGRAMLEVFAKNGANVWACVRRPSDDFAAYSGRLADECSVRIMPIYFDLADPGQSRRPSVRSWRPSVPFTGSSTMPGSPTMPSSK